MAAPRVRVYHGPPNYRNNRELFRTAVAHSKPPDFGFLYLVHNPQRAHQLNEWLLSSIGHCFESPFLTLNALIRHMTDSAALTCRILSELEKQAVLSTVLKENPHCVHLGRDGEGLAYLSQYISFIKAHNIRDEALLKLRYTKLKSAMSSTDKALIQLFGSYQKFLEENQLEDRAGVHCLICDGLLTGSLSVNQAFPDVSKMILENVQPSTPVEKTILGLAISELDEVEIKIDTLQGEDTSCLWKWLDFLPVDRESIQWIENSPAEEPERRLYSSPNRLSEVEWVARKIAGLLENREIPDPARIAVSAVHSEDYLPLIQQVFPVHEIPYYVSTGYMAGGSRRISDVACFLGTVRRNYSRKSVFNFLHRLDKERSQLEPRVLQNLEDAATFLGLEEGLECWTERLPAHFVQSELAPNLLPQEELEESSDAAQRLASILRNIAPDIQPQRSLMEWWDSLSTPLAAFLASERGDMGLSASRRENMLVGAFLAQLSQRCTLPGQTPLSFDEFTESVFEQMEHTLARTDFREQAVVIGSPSELAPSEFQQIFWLGLTEKDFPSQSARRGFFDEADSSKWGFLSWEDRLTEDHRLFQSWSSSATHRITYSFPRKVGEVPVRHSPILDGLQLKIEMAPGLSEITDDARDPFLRCNVTRGRDTLRSRESGEFSTHAGLLLDPRATQALRGRLFPKGLIVSPSRLERYFQCGYRFFLESVLRLRKPIQPQLELAPLETGNLIHRVLFRFFDEYQGRPSESRESCREKWIDRQKRIMGRILKEEWDKLGRDSTWHEQAFLLDQKQKIEDGLRDRTGKGLLSKFIELQWEWLRKFQIEHLEIDIPPTVIGSILPDSTSCRPPIDVSMKGKIDRVDRGPSGDLVIDYKTGTSSLARVAQGWGFQLPMYVRLLQSVTGRKPAGAFFYVLAVPSDIRMRPLLREEQADPSDLDSVVGYYTGRSLALSRQLYLGHFPVTLLKVTAAGCSFCEFRQVCRYNPLLVERLRESGDFLYEESVLDRGSWVGPRQGPSAEGKGPGSPERPPCC